MVCIYNIWYASFWSSNIASTLKQLYSPSPMKLSTREMPIHHLIIERHFWMCGSYYLLGAVSFLPDLYHQLGLWFRWSHQGTISNLVCSHISSLQFQVYAPAVQEKRKLKNGSYSIKARPLFPGCVFLRCILNKELHDFIRECDGVGGFVGSKVGNTWVIAFLFFASKTCSLLC